MAQGKRPQSGPRSITSENAERALAGLRLGMTRRAAAAHGGFSASTFYRMISDDGTFATEVEKAEGEAEATYSAIIAKATVDPKNWTAAAWWLERRHSHDYGRKDRVEMTIDLRREAEKLGEELGLSADEVLAEAEAILSGGS